MTKGEKKPCTECKFMKVGCAIWGKEETWCDNQISVFYDLLTPDTKTCKDWKKK